MRLFLMISCLMSFKQVDFRQENIAYRPISSYECPIFAPIKGNMHPSSGEFCIYHIPGGNYYNVTTPDVCFITEDDAKDYGCRKSER